MTVVHCKRERYTHYIGRTGSEIPPLANRYSHKPSKVTGVIYVATREGAIQEFEIEVRNSDMILNAIFALPADAILGCWCKPQACHGNTIIKIWNELHGVEQPIDKY